MTKEEKIEEAVEYIQMHLDTLDTSSEEVREILQEVAQLAEDKALEVFNCKCYPSDGTSCERLACGCYCHIKLQHAHKNVDEAYDCGCEHFNDGVQAVADQQAKEKA